MSSKDLNIAKKIDKLSKNIRKKYLSLKLGRSEEDKSLEKHYKPIITSIENFQKTNVPSVKSSIPIKKPPSSLYLSPQTLTIKQSPSTSFIKTPLQQNKAVSHKILNYSNLLKSEKNEKEEEDVFETNNDSEEEEEEKQEDEPSKIYTPEVYKDYLNDYPKTAQSYIDGFLHDDKKKVYDKTYGVIHDSKIEKWMLGKSVIDFESQTGNIIINNKTYKGTKGLYELIFKKQPTNYTTEDKKNYQEILLSTNVYKRDFDPKGQVRGTNQIKYLEIIRPLIQEKLETRKRFNTFSGYGVELLKYNSKPIEYVYWNDLNELVDRLRLLIAEETAGNTSHTNEIQSILNELKEEGVIL